MKENGNNGLRAKTTTLLTALRQRRHPIWFYKTYGTPYTRAGVADFLVVISGQFGALELKSTGEKPRPNQVVEAQWVDDVGGIAGVACDRAGVITFLMALLDRAYSIGAIERREYERLDAELAAVWNPKK